MDKTRDNADKTRDNSRHYVLRIARLRFFEDLLGLPSRVCRARVIPRETTSLETVLGLSGQIASRADNFIAFHVA